MVKKQKECQITKNKNKLPSFNEQIKLKKLIIEKKPPSPPVKDLVSMFQMKQYSEDIQNKDTLGNTDLTAILEANQSHQTSQSGGGLLNNNQVKDEILDDSDDVKHEASLPQFMQKIKY